VAKRFELALALACLVAACGRSELDDLGGAPSDAGLSVDAPPREGDGGTADGSLADGGGPDASTDAPGTVDTSSPDAPVPLGDGGAPGCNPTTCPASCCLPDGTCVQDENNQACGSGGTACKTCGPGQFCKGDCVDYQADCNASSCPGCCETAGICAAGESNYACGHAGEECQRCVPGEGTGQCVPQADAGGTCEALTTCSPADCAGCCEGNACLVGDADDACGSDGEVCKTCGGGKSCTFDTTGQYGAKNQYVCAATSPCDTSTCAGCCDGLVCAEGTQGIACGSGGVACANCQSAGQVCAQGACH
jgi:hypothetical protein